MSTAALIATLGDRKLTLSVAESCTGGGLGAALTDVAGASSVFMGGIIAYSNAIKIEFLDVDPENIEQHGAVSESVALDMALGTAAKLDTYCAISVTGVAGPGADGFKPEGRVCFGYVFGNITHVETIEFGALGRAKVRAAASDHAIKTLHKLIMS